MTPEEIKKFYDPQNEKVDKTKLIESPSGKYQLSISYFSTGPNTWNVSRGTVCKTGETNSIGVVHRNYGSFPFLFVENHPNGHDYLICGENYMGQTVIELDTGKRIDHNKNGFCWAAYSFNSSQKIIVVE